MFRLPMSQLLVLSLLIGSSTHAGEAPEHDLAALRNFTKVVISVKENYAEPQRIKPKEMMLAALNYVEMAVPDVIATGDADTGKLTVTAGSKTREFDISKVDSLWKMSFMMKDVFAFIRDNASPIKDTQAVESAAINGLLSTLDPQSTLISAKRNAPLKQATKGGLGSIGVVVQKKEGRLVLLKPLPKYSAARAGLEQGDQITRIDGEPTEAMDLEEIMSKLRGPVDSTVSVTVERKAWKKPRELTLKRSTIYVKSVQHQLLPQGIGYVRLASFQNNTTAELQAALRKLEQEAGPSGLKGLVLDMRHNPGGLFEQSHMVADVFLSEGNIVTTVGLSDKLREEKRASPQPGDNASPLVVLVDALSASATEVVAGALKHQNRAVIMGQRTFGRSSVQVLYNYPDDSALQLTIARVLAPDETSLEDGVVPDIELEPTRVFRERVRLFAPRRAVDKEAPASEFLEQPAGRVRYLETSDDGDFETRELEQLVDDFEVRFARDFVLQAPVAKRGKMMQLGKEYLEQRAREEEERVHQAIAALGIDWSPGPTPKAPNLAVTLKPGADAKTLAGQVLELEVTVENKGTEPVKRLRAWTDSPDLLALDGREFLFGAVNPGEQRSWKVAVPLPDSLPSRLDAVTVRLQDDSGMLGPSVTAELNLVELPPPAFAFSWQVQDLCDTCNGDGLVQSGETVDVRVDVTNTGAGKATGVSARVRNVSSEGVTLTDDDFLLSKLSPGETKASRFQVKVPEGYPGDTVALKLFISDESGATGITETLDLPVRQEAPQVKGTQAVVRLEKKTELLAAPEVDARPLGRLLKSVVVRQVAQVDGFAKVMLEENRFAFVNAKNAKRGPRLKPAPVTAQALEPTLAPEPRRLSLSLDGVQPAQGGLATSEDHFTLSGTAAFAHAGPVELYVLVNDQKVFFQKQSEDKPTPLAFSTSLALKEGINYVLVVARESPEAQVYKTLVIRRRPASTLAK